MDASLHGRGGAYYLYAAPRRAWMDSRTKIRRTLDALFGQGAGAALPGDAGITAYRRNGRPRAARLGGTLLCTLRTDGGIAVTPRFAQMLLGRGRFRQSCVEVDAESRPFVERGRSVFCGHVEWCGSDVAVGAEAAALFGGRVIAVGRAALPAAAHPLREERRGGAHQG